MIRHLEIHHRTEVGRTAVRHYVNNVLDRTERMAHGTLEDVMTYAYCVAADSADEVLFFIDGVEFAVTA